VWDEKSKQEQELASRLDEYNLPYRNAKKQLGWMSDRGDFRLTPREGLRLALARADFKMARSFAKTVLSSDPDNAQANFALGMGYFLEERYPLAESHLKRCLEKKPNEPAVLNNLAVIALRLGRANEALEYAQRAFEAAPESADINRTLEKARTAVSNMK
jgi:tetratricopeptide (TPR) repeat protein